MLRSGFSLRATGIVLLLQSSDTTQKCAQKLIAEKSKTIILEVGIVLLVMLALCRYNKVITHDECNHPSKDSHCYSSSHRECGSAATVHSHSHTRGALLCLGRTLGLTCYLAFGIWVITKYFYNHKPWPLIFLLLESGRLVWNSPKRSGHRMSL